MPGTDPVVQPEKAMFIGPQVQGGSLGITWEQAGHVADALAVPGFLFGTIGLGMAWWQAREASRQARNARTAAEAARDAASHTETAIGRSALLAAIPGFQDVELALTDAIAQNSAELARAGCADWRTKASHVRGLLEAAELSTPALLSLIQESMSLAVKARSEVIRPDCTEIPTAVGDLLLIAGRVTDELTSLASRESYRTGRVK
ncbi:hypothetical protein AB0D32_05640 [Micromonospora sp. NPDC048170]|uniref:hypothetical protein n=1 Tax=Micromonospora sp. NPDC048170 TaxID=3154819 RepID=UPI0033D46369